MASGVQQILCNSSEVLQHRDTRTLELAYEDAKLHIAKTCSAEETRQLHIRILLLDFEKLELCKRLDEDDHRNYHLSCHGKQLEDRLNEATAQLKRARLDKLAMSHQVDVLKAELVSMQSVASDTTKILTEKLSLNRELAHLKPELEHLRSQTVSHQSILLEKLELQRQLSHLEIQLETEKRSLQHARLNEGLKQTQDAKLESQIESLEVELVKERQQRERSEKEFQRRISDWESKNTTLESRLITFRNKLRITKEQLREAQAAVKLAHIPAPRESEHTRVMGIKKDFPQVSLKRKSVHLEADSMLGTPGDLPAIKKTKISATLPGDKSNFSITPFLNRVSSIRKESSFNECSGSDNDQHM